MERNAGQAAASIGTFLRNGIAAGRFAPGQRLVESELTAELGVSRGPLREALRQLSAEGLVEIVQSEPYAPIHVRAGAPRHANMIDYGDDRAEPGPQGTES